MKTTINAATNLPNSLKCTCGHHLDLLTTEAEFDTSEYADYGCVSCGNVHIAFIPTIQRGHSDNPFATI